MLVNFATIWVNAGVAAKFGCNLAFGGVKPFEGEILAEDEDRLLFRYKWQRGYEQAWLEHSEIARLSRHLEWHRDKFVPVWEEID